MRNPGHRNAGRWIWLAVVLVKPINRAFFKRRWGGQEHVPPTGPVLLVANHVSQADWLTVAEFVWDAGRIPRFLIKDSLFRFRGIGHLLRGAKQIPVSRGTAAARNSLEEAQASLARATSFDTGARTWRFFDQWPPAAAEAAARPCASTRRARSPATPTSGRCRPAPGWPGWR